MHAEVRHGYGAEEYPSDTQCYSFDFQTMTEPYTSSDGNGKDKDWVRNARAKKQTL